MFRKMKRISVGLLTLMLLSACGIQPKAPTQSTAPLEIDFKPYITFTNASGEKLYLGMSREDCEEILGITIEDGWRTNMSTPENSNGGLSVESLDGIIRSIGSSTPEWKMDNGISVGTGKDAASEGLGEPVESSDNGGVQYALADGYKILFVVGSDGKLTAVRASWTTDGDEDTFFGIRQLIGSGTGNAHVEGFISPREFLDISHDGSGAFKVVLNTAYMENNQKHEDSFVIIDRTGRYKGRVFCPSKHVISCDVVANGQWSIWADMYSYAAIIADKTAFCGVGDFATLYFDPDAGGIAGHWKVSHEGNGKFILKTNSFYTEDLNAKAKLLEIDGAFSEEIQVENTRNEEGNIIPMAFEIITDGSWTLERAP